MCYSCYAKSAAAVLSALWMYLSLLCGFERYRILAILYLSINYPVGYLKIKYPSRSQTVRLFIRCTNSCTYYPDYSRMPQTAEDSDPELESCT